MTPSEHNLDLVAEHFRRALAASPADETELVWIATRTRRTTAAGKAKDADDRSEATLCVRVRERGRVGTHRTGSGEFGDIENAIRAALGQARSHEPLPGLPHLPGGEAGPPPPARPETLFDPELAALGHDEAVTALRRWVGRAEWAQLRWRTGAILVSSSRGGERRADTTGASLEVRSGKGTGVGLAAGAARTLTGLAAERIVARARGRDCSKDSGGDGQGAGASSPSAPSGGALPIWLSAEATAALVYLLAGTAFTAHSYRSGSSFLRQHLGTQVFDRRLTLIDDGTDPSGMPFPFDLEGASKRRVELIAAGTPRTPALDQRHAALFGLPATGHASGGDDARAENLFLLPGGDAPGELARAAAGGVFVAALDHGVTYPPHGTQLRARLRGVRRVTAAGLGEALPDLIWEDSLLRALSHVLAVGDEAVCTAPGDDILGGVNAPELVIDGVKPTMAPPAR